MFWNRQFRKLKHIVFLKGQFRKLKKYGGVRINYGVAGRSR